MHKNNTVVRKTRKLRKSKRSRKNKMMTMNTQSKRSVGSGKTSGERSIFLGIPINFEEFCRITKYTSTNRESTDVRPMTRFLKDKGFNLIVDRMIRDQYVLGYQIESFSYHAGEEKSEDGRSYEEGFKPLDNLIDELRDKRVQFKAELHELNPEIDKVYLYPYEGVEVDKDDEEYLEKMYREPEPYIFNLCSTHG